MFQCRTNQLTIFSGLPFHDRAHMQSILDKLGENIITNPIDTPRGYKNPSRGITLRGPHSQFFSGIYLKPLDDAVDHTDGVFIELCQVIVIASNLSSLRARAKQTADYAVVLYQLHLKTLCTTGTDSSAQAI